MCSHAILGVLLVISFLPQTHSRRERSYAPITKEGLIQAIKIRGLTPPELIARIKERGVAFQVTPDVETELRKAGASTEIIETCKAYYQWSQDKATGEPKPGNSDTRTWKYIGHDDAFDYYVCRPLVVQVMDNGRRRMWTKEISTDPPAENPPYFVSLAEYDCADRRMRDITVTDYDPSTGKQSDVSSFFQEWKRVIPKTFNEKYLNIACRARR